MEEKDGCHVQKEGIEVSFKSVELQVAIPRSQDAGKMQEQMMKQGEKFQETLTEQQLQQQLANQKRVNPYTSVEKQVIKEEEKREKERREKEAKEKKQQKQKAVYSDHPYLGNRVDFSR